MIALDPMDNVKDQKIHLGDNLLDEAGTKVKNIGFNGCISTWILHIYWWIFLHKYRYIKN